MRRSVPTRDAESASIKAVLAHRRSLWPRFQGLLQPCCGDVGSAAERRTKPCPFAPQMQVGLGHVADPAVELMRVQGYQPGRGCRVHPRDGRFPGRRCDHALSRTPPSARPIALRPRRCACWRSNVGPPGRTRSAGRTGGAVWCSRRCGRARPAPIPTKSSDPNATAVLATRRSASLATPADRRHRVARRRPRSRRRIAPLKARCPPAMVERLHGHAGRRARRRRRPACARARRPKPRSGRRRRRRRRSPQFR